MQNTGENFELNSIDFKVIMFFAIATVFGFSAIMLHLQSSKASTDDCMAKSSWCTDNDMDYKDCAAGANCPDGRQYRWKTFDIDGGRYIIQTKFPDDNEFNMASVRQWINDYNLCITSGSYRKLNACMINHGIMEPDHDYYDPVRQKCQSKPTQDGIAECFRHNDIKDKIIYKF